MKKFFSIWIAGLIFCVIVNSLSFGMDKKWLLDWEQKNDKWQVMHFSAGPFDNISALKEYIITILEPMGYNVLILTVDYNLEFESHPELSHGKLTKKQARELTDLCRSKGIRLIPMFNCVGHQSWLDENEPLLLKYPEFDQTPHVPYDNKGVYCREWCAMHPGVNKIVFALMDEIVEAFDADAIHLGMDEIFLAGYPPKDREPWGLHTDWKPGAEGKDEPFPAGPGCKYCGDKKPDEIIAKAINDYHQHFVEKMGLEMLIWSDRLLPGEGMPYGGNTEVSLTGSAKAIDKISKDIIMCDWHYSVHKSYPSIDYFEQKGFRVLASVWQGSKAARAFMEYAQKHDKGKYLGMINCGWSVTPAELIRAFSGDIKDLRQEAPGIAEAMKAVCGDTEQKDPQQNTEQSH